MSRPVQEYLGDVFDAVRNAVEEPRMQGRLSALIFWIFLGTLAVIELKRRGFMPPVFAAYVPSGYFDAVTLAFMLVLALELLSLIFAISCSFSRALAKQFQILGLILLRNAFKELSHLHEPIDIAADWPTVLNIGILGAAALAVFVCLNLYQRLPQPVSPMSGDQRMRYVLAKKMLGMGLLGIFVLLAVRDTRLFFTTGKSMFFENVYTALIFADVALVLIAQRYVQSFHATFRNVGFVLATLLIRIALGTPPPWDACIGIIAALYALALTWAITRFDPRTIPPRPLRPNEKKEPPA
jgi:hypothetical protein